MAKYDSDAYLQEFICLVKKKKLSHLQLLDYRRHINNLTHVLWDRNNSPLQKYLLSCIDSREDIYKLYDAGFLNAKSVLHDFLHSSTNYYIIQSPKYNMLDHIIEFHKLHFDSIPINKLIDNKVCVEKILKYWREDKTYVVSKYAVLYSYEVELYKEYGITLDTVLSSTPIKKILEFQKKIAHDDCLNMIYEKINLCLDYLNMSSLDTGLNT